jgi:hypothetical protein
MMRLIGILLVVWLVFAIVGAVVKGLFWLTLLAGVLFVATAVWGWTSKTAHQ